MPPAITRDPAAAAAALAAGHLVAFPTETVYGLGADAANPAAVAALYRAKNRPPSHPVILHFADLAAAAAWLQPIPPAAAALAARHMPGPLTLLLRRRRAPHLSGGVHLAVRVPAHPAAQAILRQFGGAIAAPSANRFGAISPTRAAHVAADFADRDDILILDGGASTVGIESTIVGFRAGRAYIARPGHITAADIRAAGIPLTDAPADLAAPGRLPRHYAPRTPLHIIDNTAIPAHLAARAGTPIAVLSPTRPAAAAAWRRAAATPQQYARNLYTHLRTLDKTNAKQILVARPPATDNWRAITDRLTRAATPAK